MLANSINEIVKMTPKRNNALDLFDNWRNLTMLTTTYKIISKLLAKHFKPVVPKVVNKQQTGFVQGRCITENILIVKLA